MWAPPPTCRPSRSKGRPLDARSDVFSFGAVLYEILAAGARSPESHRRVLSAVLRDDPPRSHTPVRSRDRAPMPGEAPGHRFQTMPEVKAALEDCVGRRPRDPRASIAVLPFAT